MEKFNPNILNLESHPEYKEIIDICEKLENLSNDKSLDVRKIILESKVLVKEMLELLSEDISMELTPNVTGLYQEMNRLNLLARVESLKKIFKCLLEEEPIKVGSEDKHYANSVTANIEGLQIAMAEGEAPGPVRLLVGMDLNALIGFHNDHLNVSEIDEQEFDLRDSKLRSAYCRHISGDIRKEDLKYLILRIPRHFFPSENMTPSELASNNQPFIFRGANLKQGLEDVVDIDQIAA